MKKTLKFVLALMVSLALAAPVSPALAKLTSIKDLKSKKKIRILEKELEHMVMIIHDEHSSVTDSPFEDTAYGDWFEEKYDGVVSDGVWFDLQDAYTKVVTDESGDEKHYDAYKAQEDKAKEAAREIYVKAQELKKAIKTFNKDRTKNKYPSFDEVRSEINGKIKKKRSIEKGASRLMEDGRLFFILRNDADGVFDRIEDIVEEDDAKEWKTSAYASARKKLSPRKEKTTPGCSDGSCKVGSDSGSGRFGTRRGPALGHGLRFYPRNIITGSTCGKNQHAKTHPVKEPHFLETGIAYLAPILAGVGGFFGKLYASKQHRRSQKFFQRGATNAVQSGNSSLPWLQAHAYNARQHPMNNIGDVFKWPLLAISSVHNRRYNSRNQFMDSINAQGREQWLRSALGLIQSRSSQNTTSRREVQLESRALEQLARGLDFRPMITAYKDGLQNMMRGIMGGQSMAEYNNKMKVYSNVLQKLAVSMQVKTKLLKKLDQMQGLADELTEDAINGQNAINSGGGIRFGVEQTTGRSSSRRTSWGPNSSARSSR